MTASLTATNQILSRICRGVTSARTQLARISGAALGLSAAALFMGHAQPVAAQEAKPGVLLELYTSQGCSSCPPAEAMMIDLAELEDVIPLALHVDYWDYIGWKDTFADPANTNRQKAYAHAHRQRTIYTPQMIVGGVDVVVGAKPMKLADHLMAHRMKGQSVVFSARRDGNTLTVTAPVAEANGAMVVDIVRYIRAAEVKVTRGENAGRNLTHVNVVRDWARLAEWNGSAPLQIEVPVSGDEPIAIVFQEAEFGAVLGAARIE